MKYYNFEKAIELINENAENIKCAVLGFHEDWFWTAGDVWKDGDFTVDLSSENVEIMGINSSYWATPTLQLIFKDDTDKMIPCYVLEGEERSFEEQVTLTATRQSEILGCMSSELQENITPLTNAY